MKAGIDKQCARRRRRRALGAWDRSTSSPTNKPNLTSVDYEGSYYEYKFYKND